MSLRPQPRHQRKVSTTMVVDGVRDEGLTEQSHLGDVGIHYILKRHAKTGIIDHLASNPHYGDYTDAPGYQEAMNTIAAAKSLFESLPSEVRRDMDNSPQQFVDFMQNPDNRSEIEAYGLTTDHLPPLEAEPLPLDPPGDERPTEDPT